MMEKKITSSCAHMTGGMGMALFQGQEGSWIAFMPSFSFPQIRSTSLV
jgi:hypothetical protein